MPNSIALFKNYVPILDEVYREASRTAVLDGAPELARAGANAGELIIPKMTMDGLADYARASGYVDGNVTLTNETVLCNFDRGRMFTVDTMTMPRPRASLLAAWPRSSSARRSCRSWTPSASPAMLASPASVPRRPCWQAART